jgi:hypothetical protein
MKKSMLITAVIVLLIGANATAQSLKQYTWDSYKTKFKIGTDWTVTESTGTSFSAGNHDIVLSIYPRTGGHNDYTELKNGLRSWAADSKAAPDDKGYKELTNLNGYHGCMMDGFYNDGTQQCFMMNVVDPDYTDIHLYVWIAYNTKSFETAKEVLNSFTPN